ncbi:MAG: sodium-translocating pyrophosphatase [Candidatus Lokiarchaeota archaeon]|nr:sodium-translocating pyrophosphatase [Candidatus Lokiarchaeota archaeon]
MLYELSAILDLRDVLENITENLIFFIALYFIIPITLIASFVCIIFIFRKIRTLEEKTVKMRELNSEITKGAKIYLKDQSKTLLIVLAILFIPVGITGLQYLQMPVLALILTGLIFLLGALSSLFAGYIGMISATKTNILVVEASIDDPNEGFKLAYYGGMVTGILNISLFVLGIWLLLLITGGNIYLLVGYNFGASVAALFAQVGGGIYTKSADMGADLVGKYEMDIQEDDPRNPAIIADLVGDNVGDCAGRGADLFESASSDAVGGMLLGLTLFTLIGDPIFILTNITIISLGMFSLFFTTMFLDINLERPSTSIWKVFISSTLFNVIVLLVINFLFFGVSGLFLFFSSLIGLLAVFLTIVFTTYYTRIEYEPTKGVAVSSDISPSVNILSGISTGFRSTFGPIVIFVIAVVGAYVFGYYTGETYSSLTGNGSIGEPLYFIAFGIFGVNMASCSSDIIISTVLSFDTFGPIADNSAGIAQMAEDEAPEDLRENLDKLDAVGNTTKAVAKGFALVCGGFSSIVMFLTFLMTATNLAPDLFSFIPKGELTGIFDMLDINNPLIILGLSIGTVLSTLFAAQIFKGVQRGTMDMVQEVRCQFDETPGLKEGKAKPDYQRCIDISTKNALRYMMQPVVLIIVIELVVGIFFGPMVIGAFLIGNLIGCLINGLWMSVGGASYDNAKKAIETGLFGGKGSFAHKSSIIGDTVGDPLKDAAGPSMNILITTINTLALTFLPIFIMSGFLWNLIPTI